jgi:hypothetical protein
MKKKINNVQVNKVCNCVAKFLKSKVPLSRAYLKKLSPHKNTLRILASKKTSMKTKRQLIQKGGFFIGSVLRWAGQKRLEEAHKQRQLKEQNG